MTSHLGITPHTPSIKSTYVHLAKLPQPRKPSRKAYYYLPNNHLPPSSRTADLNHLKTPTQTIKKVYFPADPKKKTMSASSNSNSHSFSTFQSTSFSSVTDSSGTTRAEHTYSDPSGTTITTAEKLPGEQRAKYETREYPAGRRVEGGERERGRIEEVGENEGEEEGEGGK